MKIRIGYLQVTFKRQDRCIDGFICKFWEFVQATHKGCNFICEKFKLFRKRFWVDVFWHRWSWHMELCFPLDSPESAPAPGWSRGVIDAVTGDVNYLSRKEVRGIFVIKKKELGQPFSEVICGWEDGDRASELTSGVCETAQLVWSLVKAEVR